MASSSFNDIKKAYAGDSDKKQANAKFATTEQVLFDTYAHTVRMICGLDKSIVLGNLNVAKNMPYEDDRIVPLESVMFIADNIGPMIAMTGLNYGDTRDVLSEAINAEIMIDDVSPEDRDAFRAVMEDDMLKNSKNFIKIGVSVFSSSVLSQILDHCKTSLTDCSKIGDEFEKHVKAMSKDERAILTIILSNFIYLLRAFSKNGAFLARMAELIMQFKSEYGIK
jgi:hypothetical protein